MFSGYKTIIFNLVMGAVMLVKSLNPEAEMPDEATINSTIDMGLAALAAIWVAGGLILRAITDSPIFNKDKAMFKGD